MKSRSKLVRNRTGSERGANSLELVLVMALVALIAIPSVSEIVHIFNEPACLAGFAIDDRHDYGGGDAWSVSQAVYLRGGESPNSLDRPICMSGYVVPPNAYVIDWFTGTYFNL